MNTINSTKGDDILLTALEPEQGKLSMQDFLHSYGKGLLESLQEFAPPIYQDTDTSRFAEEMAQLKRQPYKAQYHAACAVTDLLLDNDEDGAILYGEMGCGKTMMAITAAHLFALRGKKRSLVICPPHLVYKWRREIIETLPDVETLVLNGPETISRLLKLRKRWQNNEMPNKPFVVIMGRVRMRLGFFWKPAPLWKLRIEENEQGILKARNKKVIACPQCGSAITNHKKDELATIYDLDESRMKCSGCSGVLWSMKHRTESKSLSERLIKTLTEMPTIGKKSAENLVNDFGEEPLAKIMDENLYDFVNLAKKDGNFVFNDRQAHRIERYLGHVEYSLGQGIDYQPSEFIKRYFPQGFFDLLIVDEAHELKGGTSAQGQAFGTLASSCRKKLLLTGTLMGGYASDLFYLLWRLSPKRMLEDGFKYRNGRNGVGGSLGAAEMEFMRQYGVIKDIYVSSNSDDSGSSYRTAKGENRVTHRTAKAPGYSPVGLMRNLVPITSFVRMTDIGEGVLPSYDEDYIAVEMSEQQDQAYQELSSVLVSMMKQALAKGDRTLMGMVLQTTLAWPDCCFRREICTHPRTGEVLVVTPAIFGETEMSPKEKAIIAHIKREKAANRRCLLYTVYSGTRDTTARWRFLLEMAGFKAAVLRSTVKPEKREDWVLNEVDKGIDVLVCNPDLVKTGLDLLEFPTIFFANTGYSVFTLQQASRRSWRIGQKKPVKVFFYGYKDTAQQSCLNLMAQKITVAQSTSGEIPDTGLDVLNTEAESLEVALAKEIIKTAQRKR